MGKTTALLFVLVLTFKPIQPKLAKFSLNLAFPARFLSWEFTVHGWDRLNIEVSRAQTFLVIWWGICTVSWRRWSLTAVVMVVLSAVELLHHDVSHGCLAEGFEALLPWLKGLLFVRVKLYLVLGRHAVAWLELGWWLIEIRVVLRRGVIEAVHVVKFWLMARMHAFCCVEVAVLWLEGVAVWVEWVWCWSEECLCHNLDSLNIWSYVLFRTL